MPRAARFIEPNGFYHIISRALNDTRIFRDHADFDHLIQLAHTAKEKYPIRLFHYVLMNTHFHLVLQAPNHTALSKYIAYLKWHCTMWIRKKYNWKGPLWRERYKSLPIENENYLYACGLYIEYNPVRAGICAHPEDYSYSSYRKYHLGTVDNLTDDYEISTRINQPAALDYQSNLAKNLFSRAPAIGSIIFFNKFKHPANGCPQK